MVFIGLLLVRSLVLRAVLRALRATLRAVRILACGTLLSLVHLLECLAESLRVSVDV